MSTTTTRETTIETDPALPAVRIVREFDAPVEKVFRAHTDPALFAQWCGPHGLEMTVEEWDCRDGGAWRFTHRRGEEEHRFRGCFHEVRPNESIVQTFAYEGWPSVSLERLTLEDLGNGRTRLVGVSMAESFEARDAFVASGMETGVREGYERLDALLSS
ncbi:MAG TPA: SRPBCC family protein [Frankiaceae bacterium]|jgi:uncharacterized protein YndB with AHSA1/START domain|nr:SRPBCC family protein [Frankiaceae bacterium]